ncbi:unnamed protein product [Mycena citricolor]|uniref:HAT C-terminal dimerisation domain-containing protein n=1 Tax=Mycena citricolor TaxID=2018698 RepID=A0AAD2GWF8_9AGAR|nr:unnamed protein product [Mycena citricolor]
MLTRRLLQLQPALFDLINHRLEDLRFAGGSDEKSLAAADEVISLIDSGRTGLFWSGVQRVDRYLHPLAIASNVTQSANTRLDHVLVTLALLDHQYRVDPTFVYTSDNEAISSSLRKRWTALKRDQDLYILAVFLNPFLRGHFFSSSVHSLSRGGLFGVVRRVYMRLFKIEERKDVPRELFAEYLAYYDGEQRFSADSMTLIEFRDAFGNEDTVAFMHSVWNGLKKTLLAHMALRILAMIANSGANERAFSVMGRTYSDKTRNLLDPERAHKSLIVRRGINEAHPFHLQRKKQHSGYEVLRLAVETNDTKVLDKPDSDDEEMEIDRENDRDLPRDSVERLMRTLQCLPDDGDALDDEVQEDEIAEAARNPRVTLHFSTPELIPLEKIFDPAMFNTESPWGGSLRSYCLDSTQEFETEMEALDEQAPGDPLTVVVETD